MRDNVKISDSVRLTHLPSLNGLRGISIIIVLLSHLEYSQHHFYTKLFNGPLGVAVFFVISGFLITILCLKELELYGDLSLKKFYLRRFFRIFPVAYLYIVVIFILNRLFSLQISKIQFLGAILYLQNFSFFRSHSFTWYFGHLWSLAVEEQFYLLFPFLLNRSAKLYIVSIALLVFFLPILLFVNESWFSNTTGIIYALSHFFIKFQGIAVGCLAAVLAFKQKLDLPILNKYRFTGNITALIIIFILQFNPNYSLQNMASNLVVSILIAYILVSNLSGNSGLFFRFFNLRYLAYVGTLSYSLYVWQQIFTSKDVTLPAFFINSPYNLLMIIVVSLLSYYYFERIFLKIKGRYSR